MQIQTKYAPAIVIILSKNSEVCPTNCRDIKPKPPRSTAVVPSTEAPPRNALAEIQHPRAAVDVNIHNDPLSNPAIGHNNPGFLSGAVSGLFSGVTFNNSPVNININLQANLDGGRI